VSLPSLTLVAAMALLTVGGDYLLKLASQQSHVFRNGYFVAGACLYAAGAFGWTLAFRSMKMASVGALYSTVTVLLLVTLGLVAFRERLTWTESLGVLLGILSIGLLLRRA
jgi:multidrug transporter EmrE-like cation transporter